MAAIHSKCCTSCTHGTFCFRQNKLPRCLSFFSKLILGIVIEPNFNFKYKDTFFSAPAKVYFFYLYLEICRYTSIKRQHCVFLEMKKTKQETPQVTSHKSAPPGQRGHWRRRRSQFPLLLCQDFSGHRRRSIPVGKGQSASRPRLFPAGREAGRREITAPRAPLLLNIERETTKDEAHVTARWAWAACLCVSVRVGLYLPGRQYGCKCDFTHFSYLPMAQTPQGMNCVSMKLREVECEIISCWS